MKKREWILRISTILLGILVFTTACDDSETVPTVDTGRLTVKVVADYGTLGSYSGITSKSMTTCPVPAPLMDDPSFAAGLDCDGDGGVVTFTTPVSFSVAIKSLNFIQDDGSVVQIIPDTGTLAASEVVDLSVPTTLFAQDIGLGRYDALEMEIYYYELTMMINDPPTEEVVRIYLSDDDFPAEGGLGHHQGDITIIAADGSEAGWVQGCVVWNVANVKDSRMGIMGAGGIDPETGHARGFYGDMSLWNQAVHMQGSDQDIFGLAGGLDLNLARGDQTVTITFNLVDTWFFEDFDANGLFNPGQGAEACGGGSEWTPRMPKLITSVE